MYSKLAIGYSVETFFQESHEQTSTSLKSTFKYLHNVRDMKYVKKKDMQQKYTS